MAKKIPNVDVLTETFDTWLNRTNSVIDILGSEVITANSTLGTTGSPINPLNSRLWGTFTANTIAATTSLSVSDVFSANSSRISINAPIQIGSTVGTAGQVLASTGSGISWASITADWANPGAIGSTSPNSGVFTTVKADSYAINGISTSDFIINGTGVKTNGVIDALTPGNGINTGAFKIRARGTGRASLQFNNEVGNIQYGNISVDSTGRLYWTGSVTINTDNTLGGGINLSDEGDIADLNNGYASFRFTQGVQVYDGNKTGSAVITLKSDGTIDSTGQMTSQGSKVVTVADFVDDLIENNGYTILPNGLLIQWGFVTLGPNSGVTITTPISYNGGWWRPIVGTSVQYGNGGQNENFGYAGKVGGDSFRIWNSENFSLDATWIVIGKAL